MRSARPRYRLGECSADLETGLAGVFGGTSALAQDITALRLTVRLGVMMGSRRGSAGGHHQALTLSIFVFFHRGASAAPLSFWETMRRLRNWGAVLTY